MTGFTKLWSEILTSSIWNEDDKTRLVWITMLAAMGPDYIVRASVGGLAHQARVSREDCEKALDVLRSPDPDSRSREHEGRRIIDIDGGYMILNGGKYREARSHDERKTYMAEYMRNYRKQGVNNGKQSVKHVNRSKPQLAQAEAEAEAEAEAKRKESLALPFASPEFSESWNKWIKYRKEIKKQITPTMAESQLKNLAAMGEKRAIAMIENTIGKGWQGLREESENFFGSTPKKAKYQSCL